MYIIHLVPFEGSKRTSCGLPVRKYSKASLTRQQGKATCKRCKAARLR